MKKKIEKVKSEKSAFIHKLHDFLKKHDYEQFVMYARNNKANISTTFISPGISFEEAVGFVQVLKYQLQKRAAPNLPNANDYIAWLDSTEAQLIIKKFYECFNKTSEKN